MADGFKVVKVIFCECLISKNNFVGSCIDEIKVFDK